MTYILIIYNFWRYIIIQRWWCVFLYAAHLDIFHKLIFNNIVKYFSSSGCICFVHYKGFNIEWNCILWQIRECSDQFRLTCAADWFEGWYFWSVSLHWIMPQKLFLQTGVTWSHKWITLYSLDSRSTNELFASLRQSFNSLHNKGL